MTDPRVVQLYCVADPMYFENPDRLADAATRYRLDAGPLPDGWRRSHQGLWTVLSPDGAQVPEQGWKIHVSTVADRAEAVLDAVAAACLPRRAAFKFLRSHQALMFCAGKYMPRANSGKFVTVYPADQEQFSELLAGLVPALDGVPGPYILSDLRIGGGPVHVRYGAFVELSCPGPNGTPVLALRRPDGELVPDERGPVFRLPDWVQAPRELDAHMAARAAATTGLEFPYRVLNALHFTNAGGIYLAQHRDTGDRVVLREARPHAGLDSDGLDAVGRLRREYQALTALDAVDCVPRVRGLHTVWEHEFMAEDYVPGETLLSAIVTRYPLVHLNPAQTEVDEYLAWVDKIVRDISRALDALRERGMSFGDLHPGNVIVRPGGTVALVDFEYAARTDSGAAPRAGAPGFAAPAWMAGPEADLFALRRIWLMMLLPMVELADYDPGKAATLERVGRELFGLGPEAGPPPSTCARAVGSGSGSSGESEVEGMFELPVPDWPRIRDQLAAGIVGAATPERTDRLFPGGLQGFAAPPAAVAHGAAGVLLALHRVGVKIPAQFTDWLVASARRTPAEAGRGLFDGLHGVAAVLDELGLHEEALETLARCEGRSPAPAAGMFAGLAGVALNHCHFALRTDDSALLDRAIEASRRLDAALSGDDTDIASSATAGLMHGMTGAALLHLRLHRITGEAHYLSAARRALQHDIGHCVTMPDGTIQVKRGHRHLLYLDAGSGGIALAARDYLEHREDPQLAAFVAAVRPGCGHRFVREPGLFTGRAGLLAILARLTDEPSASAQVLGQVSRLGWQLIHRDGALLVPGERLRRYSADLAFGAAGVLLSLHAVFDGGAFLPLDVGAVASSLAQSPSE